MTDFSDMISSFIALKRIQPIQQKIANNQDITMSEFTTILSETRECWKTACRQCYSGEDSHEAKYLKECEVEFATYEKVIHPKTREYCERIEVDLDSQPINVTYYP
jgi:hypothetical protein